MKTILSILITVAIIYFAIKYWKYKQAKKNEYKLKMFKDGFKSVSEYARYLRGMVRIMDNFKELNRDYVLELIEVLRGEVEGKKEAYDLDRMEWYAKEINKYIK